MKSSRKDNAEGKMHLVKGKIKEIAGKVIMNPDLDFHKKILALLERNRTCFGPYL